ncbi:MAG: L-rhamnose mutarotase [Phycisphaerae bacterium]|nr:L-rhamnose mutarotase [Phycisphaerae bacterium]
MKSYLFGLIALVVFFAGCSSTPDSSSVKAVYGTTNPTADQKAGAKVKRFASVIELLPEKEQSYRRLHADVWPKVVTAVKKANIQNYSIFMTELAGKKYLFSYLEYAGDDLEKDFAQLKENPTIRDKWWPITDACQKRLPDAPKGEQWKPIEMLMHIP